MCRDGEVVAILEAMKLEISVRAEEGVRGKVGEAFGEAGRCG